MGNPAKTLGHRIRTSRERLGLSQEELAKRAGFSVHQIISQIEKGKREVKAWELANLAKVLMTDISTLLSNQEPEPLPVVLWREAPKEDAETKEADFLQRCQRYAYLEKLCNVDPRRRLPQREVDPNKSVYIDAHELAEDALRQLGLGARPAASLVDTLENSYGVKVLYADLGEEGSAASTIGSFGSAILMNSVEAPWRRNFNFAHEVFHLLTWKSIPPERMIADPAFRDRIESLANAFASSLLLPGDSVSIAIERHVKDGKIYHADLVEIAREFDVSTAALLYRLLNLGYFDREAVERLLNNPTFRQLDRSTMTASWWEPPPIPERFVRLAFWAYQEGNISRTKLAEYLNVSLLDLTDTLLEYGLDDRENYKAEMLTSRR